MARWGRPELLASTALTLGELLGSLPELEQVRFGFLEGPGALTCCGAGPAAVEYVVDHHLLTPQGTGTLETILPPLAELETVVVRRVAGGYRVEMTTRRLARGTPYSTLEAGTGDLGLNLLRGLFVSRFWRGEFGFGIDRVETGGFQDLGSTDRIGVWLAYARRLPLGIAGSFQWRGSSVERRDLEAPERSDLVARLRRPFGSRLMLDFSAARASTTIDVPESDTMPARHPESTVLAVHAVLVGRRGVADVRLERWVGDAVPDIVAALDAEWNLRPWLALGAEGRRSRWGSRDFDEGAARLLLRPGGSFSLGLEFEAGSRKVRGVEELEPVDYRRATAQAKGRILGLDLQAAVGRWRLDRSLPFGFEFERGLDPDSIPIGGDVTVWRAGGSLPTPLRPVRLTAFYERRGRGDFLYWPVDRARFGGLFHDAYLDGQLEVRVGFQGLVRGEMRSLSVETDPPSLVILPRRLGFAGEIVVRIRDVRVYYQYEGFSDLLKSADILGAPLPQSRTFFGLKWEFWN